MATTRRGSDLLQVKPEGYNPPVPLMGGEDIGGNTLVGVRADNGYAEQLDASSIDGTTTYRKVLVAVREFDTSGESNGDVVAEQGIQQRRVVKLDTDSAVSQSDLFKTVYAVDHGTVSLQSDSVGDGTGVDYPEVGRIVEFIDSNTVRVEVTE